MNPSLQMEELADAARRFALSSPVREHSTGGQARTRLMRAVVLCVRAAAVKELASALPSPLQDQVMDRANRAISNIIDDYCATTVPFVPRPWPMPSPPALELATQLTILANTVIHDGKMRTEILQIASQLATKAYDTAGIEG